MDRGFYHTGQFAEKASVTVRTLRFYDKVGLLSPSEYTEAGYRLYTDADFFRLQQILALKFLGFSLAEIRACLRVEPHRLSESLAQQRAMMQERRAQLDAIIQAIDKTEKLLQTNEQAWDSVVKVIQVMQMTQANDWRRKYLTEEQMQQMEELSKKSYTDEDRQKLAEWGKGWSEEDQRVATQRWDEVIATMKLLASTSQDPAGAEAQALAGRWSALIQEFTRGDAGIFKGLGNYYKNMGELPAEQRPMPMPYSKEEWAFMQQALDIYQQKQGQP